MNLIMKSIFNDAHPHVNVDNRHFVGVFPLSELGWDMAVDIYEKKNAVVVKMNLSGINSDDLDISLEKDVLTISGRREEDKGADKREYWSKEIRRGSFLRSLILPKIVRDTGIKSVYEDGILTMKFSTLPNKKKKIQQIQIQ